MEKRSDGKLVSIKKEDEEKGKEKESDLTLMVWNNKVYAGKFRESVNPEIQDLLVEAIEFIVAASPDGRLIIATLSFGDIFIPDDAMVASMPKSSSYYVPYFKATSNIEVPK